MDEAGVWEVDKLAAKSLLAALQVEETPEALAHVVKAFSSHRVTSCDWAAKRVHQETVSALETASLEQFGTHDMAWNEGYIAAQQNLLRLDPSDCLGLEVKPTRSKGQILRSRIRMAKRQMA